jgi:hypothetical protein
MWPLLSPPSHRHNTAASRRIDRGPRRRPSFGLLLLFLTGAAFIPAAVPEVLSGGASASAAASAASTCRSRPLGLLSGEIRDWQLAVSSVVSRKDDEDCAVKYARLYAPGKRAWCPENRQKGEWILVDLGVLSEISGVMTQGRDMMDQWVTHFYISYSEDAYR